MKKILFKIVKTAANSVGINKQKLYRFSLPFRYLHLRLMLKIQGRKAFGSNVLTRSVLMREKKEISAPQFDAILNDYYRP